MTREVLNKANQISGHINDLERLLRDFEEGAQIKVQGKRHEYAIALKHIHEDVIHILISGIKERIVELKEEFENL